MQNFPIFLQTNFSDWQSEAQDVGSRYYNEPSTHKPDEGWGWLIDRGVDMIQTDWSGMLRQHMLYGYHKKVKVPEKPPWPPEKYG